MEFMSDSQEIHDSPESPAELQKIQRPTKRRKGHGGDGGCWKWGVGTVGVDKGEGVTDKMGVVGSVARELLV